MQTLLLPLLACHAVDDQVPEPGYVDDGIRLEDVVSCEDPADSPTWTDVAEARGLLPTELTRHTMGGSSAIADLDEDGDLDIAVNYSGEMRFYLRDGDGYTMLADGAQTDARLVTVADLGRGYPEVMLGASSVPVYHVVDGALEKRFLFEDTDLVNRNPAQGAFPADIDEAGLVDLYATQAAPEGTDMVFWGVGDGWFTPDAEALPEGTRSGRGFDGHWLDYDLDLDLDLYVANDMGTIDGPNVLYRNDDGVLADASDGCYCDLAVSAMGADSADFSGDGYPDIYVSISGNQSLLQSMGDGTYLDVTRAVGIPAQGMADMGWGAVFLDLENDGDLDIFEARGDLWEDAKTGPVFDSASRVLQNDDGVFSDAADAWGLDRMGSWRVVIPHDDNGDGVLDLFVTDVIERPTLWVSDSCTDETWLDVEAPVGAAVEIEAGGRTQVRWVSTQSGMGGNRPAVAHFGLGDASMVERMTVTALDGRSWTCTEPFEPRRKVVITGQ